MKRLRKLCIRGRLWLALKIFPVTGSGVCANRSERRFSTKSIEIKIVTRDKTQPDALSWEEMMHALDIFLGRSTTPQEWKTVLFWKAGYPSSIK